MNIEKISAFSIGDNGGNPAGVVIGEALPDAEIMATTAAKVGYSETAFAAPDSDGWRVRYFSPASEVPFCGHATIALGAALGARLGAGRYDLTLNNARISVEATETEAGWGAALMSPPTETQTLSNDLRQGVMEVFGVAEDDLSEDLPMVRASAGADAVTRRRLP